MNPLVELHAQKQSFWLDYIRRDLLTSGELKRLIETDGLRGMTSNPTIFEKAIASGEEYDSDLKKFALQGKSTNQIFEELAIRDIQKATDIFRPVYKSSGGEDGFVSLEVNPYLAYDTEGTIHEALRLFKRVNRPNLMIKVPGTREGLAAVEELIFRGVNINITLLFSVKVYEQTVEAYLRGLERRAKKGLPIKNIVSVASFFVSRVDTVVNKILDEKSTPGKPDAAEAVRLLHKAAIANAKIAYVHYQAVFNSPRFEKLRAKGGRDQRLLWGSTGTKDKRLPDTVYIADLIGPHTVNTIPPATADAFRDHGAVRLTLTTGVEQARKDLAGLAYLGIDIEAICAQLVVDGGKSFQDSYDSLLRVIGVKREKLTGFLRKTIELSLGPVQPQVDQALARMARETWVKRIWDKDPSVWKNDAPHQKIIANALGWLNVANTVAHNRKRLEQICEDVKKAKFSGALLLGMGGSSLAPEVLRLTFGKKAGVPDFAILDSTQPASVLERSRRSRPEKTVFIVSSKSGSTIEPNAFFAYFFEQVHKKKGAKAGDHFIAITDPGTHMEALAKEKRFRHIVLNPPDIGGRYSALSYFGMVPGAIMGAPIGEVLSRASLMMDACRPELAAEANPGAVLGAALGTLAKLGRNKVTFVLSKDISSYGTWVEQLIAESTGKEGVGILPVESEPLQTPDGYGNDRVFVSIRTGQGDPRAAKKLAALKKAGHPVIVISLRDKSDLGGQFFLWEFATAVAGAFLGIDAFDQPNVQESKDLTNQFLAGFKADGKLALPAPTFRDRGITGVVSESLGRPSSVKEALESLVQHVQPGDYVAVLAYLERNEKNRALLQAFRCALLERTKAATTLGFGPRFLHSTGQLHKGGSNSGLFIQLTSDDKLDVPVPGQPYSFGVLKEAQILGDFRALEIKGRRVVRLRLADPAKDLPMLTAAVGALQ